MKVINNNKNISSHNEQAKPQQWLNVDSAVDTKGSLSSVAEPHRSKSIPGNKACCLAK